MKKKKLTNTITVLKLGSEGGMIRLLATQDSEPVFSVHMIDQGLVMIDEGDEIITHSVWGTWEEGLKVLDQYRWHQHHPVEIHPDYVERVRLLVKTRWDEVSKYSKPDWEALFGKSK